MAKQKISGYRPQRKNANKHTPRGMQMLEESISSDGWIGAISAAADGEVFDGSARLETVYTQFGEEVEPIVVETDGTRPVIVKRMDIASADDPKAKKLAIAANRIAQVDLDWDAAVLVELEQELDLEQFFSEKEFADILGRELESLQDEDIQDVADQSIKSDFAVVIEGLTEQSQLELIEQLTEQGYKCRALVS